MKKKISIETPPVDFTPTSIKVETKLTERENLIKTLKEYQIESKKIMPDLSLEERRQRNVKETELISQLSNTQADKQVLVPKIDKTNFPDRTIELHNLADNNQWLSFKTLYMQSKCNHYAFMGEPAATLITKAVKCGDLELIIEMLADGGNIDIPCSDPVSPISGRQWILMRGRKAYDMGQPQSMRPLAGEGPGRQPLSNNVALWDYFCGKDKKA